MGLAAIGFIATVSWAYIASTRPLPGTQTADLGRGHLSVGEHIDYNSNPPTSGKHYDDWIRSGVYGEPKQDEYLVHSLEHGYVIISYNCAPNPPGQTPKESSASAKLPQEFSSDECKQLVGELTSVYEEKGKSRLIVIPRLNLDAKIALTAWNYLDKMEFFDKPRIEKFIDSHLNMGPEKTME